MWYTLGMEIIGNTAQSVTTAVQELLAKPTPTDWQPSGTTQAAYLDIAERIVRVAVTWLDADGAIIDPVEHEEWGQTSSRFVSSAAGLLAAGRCTDLADRVLQAMDRCCQRLAAGLGQSPDFWLRELMTAYNCLQPLYPERAKLWAAELSSIDPQQINWQVEKPDQPIADLHNWTVYAAAGEAMRQQAGLAPADHDMLWGYGFFDKYMPYQLNYFSSLGMYRDPGDPITYDLTTRLQFAVALAAGAGATSEVGQQIDQHLQDAGFATLLLTSSDGLVPFGGRSAQYNFQEVMVAALCELEANRWRDTDPRLAGAFKRQAHLSIQAIQPWFAAEPFRSLKNMCPPEHQHGFDPYGKYGVYSLLTASLCVLAAQFADDAIAEAPCPAEIGGYCWHVSPAFHKVIANAAGQHLVVDTAADLKYDATGLGRLHSHSHPVALPLGMPFTADPAYVLNDELVPARPCALGPEWLVDGKWVALAEHVADPDDVAVDLTRATVESLEFSVTYPVADGAWTVEESYALDQSGLTYGYRVPHESSRLRVPLLLSDGEQASTISIEGHTVTVTCAGSQARYTFAEGAELSLNEQRFGNRNGIYQLLTVAGSDSLHLVVQ